MILCYHRRNLFVCVSRIMRKAYWEKLSRLIWRGRSIRRPIAVFSTCNNIISTAYRRELIAVFKVSCFPLLNCFASILLDIIFLPTLPSRTVYSLLLHLDPREKISSPMQDLFCSRKPLTYPGSASVHCGLHGRTEGSKLHAVIACQFFTFQYHFRLSF